MKSQIAIWWILTGFFFLLFVGYTGWSMIANAGQEGSAIIDGIEWIGTIALLFLSLFTAMIAYFMWWWHRAQGGVALPEDRLDADIDDGEAEQGEFSPWSWWPIVLAAAPAVGVLALATAHFLIPVAIFLLAIALVGWVFEYYRGNFAR